MLINVVRNVFRTKRQPQSCPICSSASPFLESLDLNKSCADVSQPQPVFPRSGHAIDYHLCTNCGFCFAPEIMRWTEDNLRTKIYNEDYIRVDPDYVEKRPDDYAVTLPKVFPWMGSNLRHLDFGGGDGRLSRKLCEFGWDSRVYDPFGGDGLLATPPTGLFELITAIEVFEHSQDPHQMLNRLASLLAPDGVIFFSTSVSDREHLATRGLKWWYAAPRNGHISLYSRNALKILGRQHGLLCTSLSDNNHVYSTPKTPQARTKLFATNHLGR
jgi:hypothetical protein